MGKQSQLLLQPTEVELGLQVEVEFDKNLMLINIFAQKKIKLQDRLQDWKKSHYHYNPIYSYIVMECVIVCMNVCMYVLALINHFFTVPS